MRGERGNGVCVCVILTCVCVGGGGVAVPALVHALRHVAASKRQSGVTQPSKHNLYGHPSFTRQSDLIW